MATASPPELDLIELPVIELEEHYEVVDGRIVEEPPLGAQEGSIASLLDQSMGYFASANRLGRVVTEVLFVLDADQGLRRRPDVAFVSARRWPVNRRVPREAAWDVVPDLAVEITSPTDSIDDLLKKLEHYFAAGVDRVWVVYPSVLKVYDYESTTKVHILQLGDELDAPDILPGFRMALSQLFETDESEPTPVA
jgi:Uma2 family endonuclease